MGLEYEDFVPLRTQRIQSTCWILAFCTATATLLNNDPHFVPIYRVGRRPVLLFSVIFILIFGLTVALSVNVTMFSTLRFFEGFCLAGIILTLYAIRK